MFFFSIFLGYQALFETLSTRGDFSTLLASFISCLGLQRDIGAIATKGWLAIERQLMPRIDITCRSIVGVHPRGLTDQAGYAEKGHKCDALIQLLNTTDSNLSDSSADACRQAVDYLHIIFDTCCDTPSLRVRTVLSWMVLLTDDFVELLSCHQPEALVILAYYDVILHDMKDFWMVGDGGQYLVRSVTEHLGIAWQKWLTWPNAAISQSCIALPATLKGNSHSANT
ncbi:uncharacterized protein FRV6_16750 [Fusarium oxysporum]|uniref:Uncharacterized protein n=1 Tax=Fusarium oxysporum TaxID=5507 RepID=A0A2H3TVH1_FUSOX|nr:uncharacterized protein FRV6_16750 [Fusarium oxysporum]